MTTVTKAASKTAAAARHPQQAAGSDVQGMIRSMAYQLYEKHGRQHGHDLADWLEAERIIRGR